ncbi:MAG: hypothetical protein ACKO27_12655 [Ilumatobacteraceae bacterium]
MKTLIWCGTVVLAAIWSLIAWMVHALVGMAGGVIESTTGIIPVDPVLAEWAAWLASAGTGVGEWLVVALWAIGSLVLLVLGFVATRFVKV